MNNLRLALFSAVILFTAFLTGPLHAASERPPSVVRAETYLRDLDTARARFLQTAQNGSQLAGTFYLNRPGKLRFDYDDPVEDFIVADGRFIYFYDSQLGEQTNAPIGQTLADFLVAQVGERDAIGLAVGERRVGFAEAGEVGIELE